MAAIPPDFNNNNNENDKDEKDNQNEENALRWSQIRAQEKAKQEENKKINKPKLVFPCDEIFDLTKSKEWLENLLEALPRKITSCLHPLPDLNATQYAILAQIKRNSLEEYSAFIRDFLKCNRSVSDIIAQHMLFKATLAKSEQNILSKEKELPSIDDLIKTLNTNETSKNIMMAYNSNINFHNVNSYAKFLANEYGYPLNLARILVKKMLDNEWQFSENEKELVKAECCANVETVFFDVQHQDKKALVIAIGTAGSALQMCPPFLGQFNHQAIVLNFDPAIFDDNSQAILKNLQKPGLTIRCSSMDCLDPKGFVHPLLLDNIDKHLKNSSIPLVLTYHIDAYIPDLYMALAKRYPDAMNSGRLVLIHAYHDYQPTICYSPEYLTNPPVPHKKYQHNRSIGPLEKATMGGQKYVTEADLKKDIIKKTGETLGNTLWEQNRLVINYGELTQIKVSNPSQSLNKSKY